MSERTNTDYETPTRVDDLALSAHRIESFLDDGDFSKVANLIEQDGIGAWFSIGPTRIHEILQLLLEYLPHERPALRAAQNVLAANASDLVASPPIISPHDENAVQQAHLVTVLRMGQFRLNGKVNEAHEVGQELVAHLGAMQPLLGSPNGADLHLTVQLGITAMLAGDFTQALTHFTRAQMHPPVPKFAFLSRDALVKSALIHASFGNSMTARSLLNRADKINRTSSWIESHIDAHRDFSEALINIVDFDQALQKLESISLHYIGELWPFYILAMHRILEAGGYRDELEHRLEMFEAMPFPRQDGNGFSGSVLWLKRAMHALRAGNGAEAQTFLDRADQKVSYTQLLQATAHVYAGRSQQAIHDVTRLRPETRGFRLMEVRRLAILAAAQYQSHQNTDCLETLKRAAELPRGLRQSEIQLFSPETRELAAAKLASWPADHDGPSAFLTGLPRPGLALTAREIEILRYLAQELTRAEIADAMFISVNTLKTHLKSVYRKLGVSTGADAVLGAQRRGLL